MTHETDLWGAGLYTVPEAARLLGVPSQRIRRWVGGRGVISRDLEAVEGQVGLSFRDLMEVRFIDAFRSHGLSLQLIRRATRKACELIGIDHPFQTRAFKTDGRGVFAELAKEDGEKILIDLVKSQYAFQQVVAPSLYAGFEYDGQLLVRRWRPMKGKSVLLDPGRAFGQPIVEHGVPTAILVETVRAEGSVHAAAKWYDIPEKEVKDALVFEEQLAA